MFYFHKVAYVQYLGEVGIFHTSVKTISSSLQQCKNYKNRLRFSKVMITNVLPPFYGSQCIILLRAILYGLCISVFLHQIAKKTRISTVYHLSEFASSRCVPFRRLISTLPVILIESTCAP